MKKLLVACVLLMVFGAASAQKIYFIYIQSDSNMPFFVKLGDKITSASAAGYVILPKLVDSVYQFTIGKTGQAASESRFSVTINKQDRGFLLREADGKFSLFDLQAMTSLQPLAAAGSSTQTIGQRTDAFSMLLAKAANDPSLLEVRAAVATQSDTKKQPEPTRAVAITTTKEPEPETTTPQQTDTATTTATTEIAASPPDTVASTTGTGTTTAVAATPAEKEPTPEPVKQDTAQQAVAKKEETTQPAVTDSQATTADETQPYKPSVVTRRSESSTSEGFGLVFLDEAEGTVDTIRILIPNPSFAIQKDEGVHEDSKRFLNISSTDTTKDSGITKEENTVAAANDKLRAAETKKHKGCTQAASERDFFKLRKNMAAEDSEEAMVDEARKAFKRTCFSTEQIKSLSSLFLTASGKYLFFDAANGHVSNQEQYASLQTELNDTYYQSRFKALIANQ